MKKWDKKNKTKINLRTTLEELEENKDSKNGYI